MMNFTYEEVNLMSLYNSGSRERLIEVLTEMRTKLAGMTDAEFDALELYPDFI